MARYNPFRPNSIITPGMFHGRLDELKFIEHSLFQTKTVTLNTSYLKASGESEKSSLFLYIDRLADGAFTIDEYSFRFLVVHVELKNSDTYFDIIHELHPIYAEQFLKKTE